MTHFTRTLALLLVAGCGGSAGSDRAAPVVDDNRRDAVIEEPDLYRLVGTTLYVQNRETGLHVIDVADASKPRLLGRAPVTGNAGAELYVQPGAKVVIMLRGAGGSCKALPGLDGRGWSSDAEVAFVDAQSPASPQILGRYCLPGTLVASRTVDQVLYAVTTNPTTGGSGSRAVSIDLADPRAPRVIAQADFAGASKEILVTASVIVVAAQATTTGLPSTRLQFFSIDRTGVVTPRGIAEVAGAPQGRFHMDLRQDPRTGAQHFRIVTFEGPSSRLSILDATHLDRIQFVGGLGGIGRSERLYATRFDGDLAYVVTFRRTDPLYVVSLREPARPQVVGELQVPGWSDFIFPRGDRLVAVGRAADTRSVGLSLFDVSDPRFPVALHQIQLGQGSTSEANLDHRGVTIVENLGGVATPAMIVPWASVTWGSDSKGRTTCTVANHLQIVDLGRAFFTQRGQADLRGSIRRSFPIGGQLFALSDYEVKSLDVSNRSAPIVRASLTLGTDDSLRTGAKETCDAAQRLLIDGAAGHCSVGRRGPGAWNTLALVALALAFVRRRKVRP